MKWLKRWRGQEAGVAEEGLLLYVTRAQTPNIENVPRYRSIRGTSEEPDSGTHHKQSLCAGTVIVLGSNATSSRGSSSEKRAVSELFGA